MRNKTKHQRDYRRPRTTQERRANHKRNQFCRGKRRACHLADAWDDYTTTIQKTWKVKRRHQYHIDGRGQEHKVFLSKNDNAPNWMFWLNTWQLEEYFSRCGVPFRIEKIEKIEIRVKTHQRDYRVVKWEPYTYVRVVRPYKNGAKKTKTQYVTKNHYHYIYKWVNVKLAKPRVIHWTTLVGYKIIWWSDKDIGINYILKGCVNGYIEK